MRRVFPWMGAVALAVSLSACGGPPNWTKDGASPDVAAADYADCRHEAQHDIQRDVNIDTDIAAARQHDWSQSQSTETHLAGDASSNRKLTRDIVSGCMESKGYVPSGPGPTNGPHWFQLFDM